MLSLNKILDGRLVIGLDKIISSLDYFIFDQIQLSAL